MRCNKCGHLNKSNVYCCAKCGNSLKTTNVTQYKQRVKNETSTYSTFSKTQKFIIALVIIGILIVVLSAVIPPDLEIPSLASPENDTLRTPIEAKDQTTNKLNTSIKIGEIAAKTGENVIVNAYVNDENGADVTGGTASITINNTKYSGQVENGNVKIILPQLSENSYEAVVVYEGNDKYNPSETKATINVNKQNSQIDTQLDNDNLIITLKAGNGAIIKGESLTIESNATQMQEKTNDEGKVNVKVDLEAGKQEIKISYAGNDIYSPTEKIIEVGEDKRDTKLDTKYNDENQTITITLSDDDNSGISDAPLSIDVNDRQQQEKTNNDGIAIINVDEGVNRITIKYEGNATFNPSETTINTVIEHNKTNNTENGTDVNDTDAKVNDTNDKVNDTDDKVNDRDDKVNDTLTKTIDTNDTQIQANQSNTSNTKIDTKVDVEREDNLTVMTLLTDDNKKISGESVKIVLDNGTEFNRETSANGSIELNINLEGVNELEIIYEGNDEYNSFNKKIHINH